MNTAHDPIRNIVFIVLIGLYTGMFVTSLCAEEEGIGTAYQCICEQEGSGLSVVDVLQATGDHDTFLNLFRRYDPEGFAILSDPVLADKTVWAPTDTAFRAISDRLSSLSDEQVKAVLGYHISPPRRTPWGSYRIVTLGSLIESGQMYHRTRTGVLTGSDQCIRTSVADGVLLIEDAHIMRTAWCTEAGSVFSVDAVIMDVAIPSVLVRTMHRFIRILLYDDIRFVIYSTAGATLIGSMVSRVVSRMIKRKKGSRST